MSHYGEQPPQMLELPGDDSRVMGCYWKPNPAFLDELAAYLKGKRVLEIFAGNGYLAACLTARGVDIVSTTEFSGHDAHRSGIYHPVLEMSARDAVLKYRSESDTLLLSWPTVTIEAFCAAILWGSSKPIAYIGEYTDYSKNQLGGCATDEFFELLEFKSKFSAYQGSCWEAA